MDKKKVSKEIAGSVVKVLDVSLYVEASTNSCMVLYQPKTPATISKFKRK